MKKKVKYGEDYIRDSAWNPKIVTLQQAQRMADKIAKDCPPKGTWRGSVADCGEYFRLNVAAMPEKR